MLLTALAILVIYYIFKDRPKEVISDVPKNEKYYQSKLCNKLGGVMEYQLKDRTRIDCLIDDYAIEVDWAKKWAEGIGQSLYYSQMSDREPAVALIVGAGDERYLDRFKIATKGLGIKIYKIERE